MEHGASMGVAAADAYLVRESQGELDLVRGDVGVPPAHDGAGNGGGPRAEGSASNTEGAHDGCGCGGDAIADALVFFPDRLLRPGIPVQPDVEWRSRSRFSIG